MIVEIGRFVFLALSNVSFFPALQLMSQNRRHFELFIGVFQLFILFCFNIAEVGHSSVFLKELQWHFISDVLSLTYFLLICVHLMGFPDENNNIILRYLAFACAWLTKSKDGWDNTLYEAILVTCYVLGAIYRRVLSQDRNMAPIRMDYAKNAVIAAAFAALTGFLPMYFGSDDEHALGVLKGCTHILGGVASYYAWLSVPCLDSKKSDLMPTYSAYV